MVRSSDPIVWPGTEYDQTFKQKMQANYNDAINILQTQWNQADLDERFVLGDQDIWGILFPGVANSGKKMFNFNLINTMKEVVSGFQRRNRKATICVPVHAQGQQTADQFTKCLYYVYDQTQGYQVISDAFANGAVTQGIGLISHYLDYSEDASGEIKMRYVDFKSLIIDPYFRQKDLSDCRYIWTRQYFDREEAAKLYPEHQDEIMSMRGGRYQDDKFYYMPEVYQIQQPNLMAFDEYFELSQRDADYIVDTETEEMLEFEGDEEDFRIIAMQLGRDRFKMIKRPKQTVKRTLLVNDRVLMEEDRPYGLDRYPFVATLGYFCPDTAYYAYKFKGIVRDARDAQYLFNRRKVADLDILESQQQGIKVKKGTLVTPEDGLNTGNGRMLVLKETADMNDVQPMPIVPPDPTMLQMEEMLRETMQRITGINEELLGSAVDDKAGILSILRQGAGLTTLQTLFDNLDYAQKQTGDIIIQMIQKNWTFAKVQKVTGEEPSPEFQDKAFFKYNAKCVQGHMTETQQQQELIQLLELQERFGPIFPMEEVVEAMTIQNKDRIMQKMIERQQAQQQQEQQMAQLQMQQLQVDNETKLAYAQSQKGLAAERVAKIQTDKAVAEDKLRRAEHEDMASLLSLVKTLKELQGMDTNDLMNKIKVLGTIQDAEFENKMVSEDSPGSDLLGGNDG